MNSIEYLQSVITKTLEKMNVLDQVIHLEHPADPKFGDYSTNIAMTSFSRLTPEQKEKNQVSNPREFAQKIVDTLQGDI
jgi:arginyl-tRNA synthetase